MELDNEVKSQLTPYLDFIEQNIVLKVSVGSDEASAKMLEFVQGISKLSDKIAIEQTSLERTPCFTIDKADSSSGIIFAGIPLGHEFSSFLMALIQVSGRKPKIEDDLIERIKIIDKKLDFTSYITLSCHNCPDVVQALNIMAVLNPNISHTMVDGALFKEEVGDKQIMAVPTVHLNGEEFGIGRMTIKQVFSKLVKSFDVI